MPSLLSAQGFNVAWTQYQQHMVDGLNRNIQDGDDLAGLTPKQIVLKTAREPRLAAIFNYASMAFNNHFFFDSLALLPQPLKSFESFHKDLVKSFGSIDALRDTMLGNARAMFGPGFVWLVWTPVPSTQGTQGTHDNPNYGFRLLNTYLAGTPFPEADFRRQGQDMSTNSAGSFGATSAVGRAEAKFPPGTGPVHPVLCVNTWEHVYLTDYKVGEKQKYLEDWWEAIDWEAVHARWQPVAKLGSRFSR